MRVIASCLVLAASSVAAAPITNPRALVSEIGAPITRVDPAELSQLTVLANPVWSPDAHSVAYISTESGTFKIHIRDLKSGRSYQPAQTESDQSAMRWSPDGTRLLFIADKDGDEMYDVYVVDLKSGKVTNVTRTAQHAEEHASWSPDGKQILLKQRHRESASSEIGVLDLSNGKLRLLTKNTSPKRTNISPRWAAAGDWIYFTDLGYSLTDANVIRIRPDGSGVENLTSHEGDALFRLADVAVNGEHILVTSDARHGWRNVALINVRTRAITWVTEERANHLAGGFSADGRFVVYNRDGDLDAHIFVYELATQRIRQLTQGRMSYEMQRIDSIIGEPNGSPVSKTNWILAVRHSGTRPAEIVRVSLEGEEHIVVPNPMPSTLVNAVVDPVAVAYRSNDGKFTVPALAWLPRNLKRDGSHPAVIEVHGGPMAQTRPHLLTYIQVLVAHGYIVISPNYRGSTGYDRNYFVANRLDLGGGDLEDVVAAGDFLIASGFVDPKKLIVYGASNGAYLTLLALGKYPERFAAGVALYPFVDFATLYASEPQWIRSIDDVLMGDPEQNAALWRERSPITFADRIRAPLMMTAGANDPRCPPEQAREMQRRIKARGGHVELTIFDEQGHGAVDTESYVDENTRVVKFMNTQIRGDRHVIAN